MRAAVATAALIHFMRSYDSDVESNYLYADAQRLCAFMTDAHRLFDRQAMLAGPEGLTAKVLQ